MHPRRDVADRLRRVSPTVVISGVDGPAPTGWCSMRPIGRPRPRRQRLRPRRTSTSRKSLVDGHRPAGSGPTQRERWPSVIPRGRADVGVLVLVERWEQIGGVTGGDPTSSRATMTASCQVRRDRTRGSSATGSARTPPAAWRGTNAERDPARRRLRDPVGGTNAAKRNVIADRAPTASRSSYDSADGNVISGKIDPRQRRPRDRPR